MNKFKSIFSKHFSFFIAVFLMLIIILGCKSKSDSDWAKILGNKKLTTAKTSGSISNKTNIWFCPSGEYAMQRQFSGFSTGGSGSLSMANEDFETGKWRVNSGTLILQSQDGETVEYELLQGRDEDVISLDGTGYLVSTHNACE